MRTIASLVSIFVSFGILYAAWILLAHDCGNGQKSVSADCTSGPGSEAPATLRLQEPLAPAPPAPRR